MDENERNSGTPVCSYCSHPKTNKNFADRAKINIARKQQRYGPLALKMRATDYSHKILHFTFDPRRIQLETKLGS